MNALQEMVLLGKLDRQVKKSEEVKKPNTDAIFSTALAYAGYKDLRPRTINDNLLKNMFKDLCSLSDEYAFDYKQELKNILEQGVK